jgi:hypothetical protein
VVVASACLTEFQFADRDGGLGCASCAAPFPYCVADRCVECRAATDCPAGPCDVETGRCLIACDRRDDRCDRAVYPRGCREDDQGIARCMACEEDEHCDAGVCDVGRGVCVACRSDAECSGARCNRTTGTCE